MTVYHLCAYFIIYSFLGWCCEVVFAAITKGKFVNRGFLNGPVCPIYGFGIIIVLTALQGVRDNFILLFFGSVLLTSVLEYITGFILEKFFHTRWWDYTKEPFNIRGYVCLRFSIMWGLACLIIVDIVHPAIERLVIHIPQGIGCIITALLIMLFIIDAVITAVGLSNTGKYLKGLTKTGQQIRKVSDSLGENLSNNTISIIQKSDELKESLDEKYAVRKQELERQRQVLQKKYAELKEKAPFTAKRIHTAFPDLHLLENAIQTGRLKKEKQGEKEDNEI